MFSAVLPSKDGGMGRGRFATAALLATGVHAAALLVLGVCSSTRAGALTSTGRAGDNTPEIAVQFMVPRAPAASASRPAPVRRRPPQPKPLATVPAPVAEHSVTTPAPVEVVAEHSRTEALAGNEVGSGGSGVLGGPAGGHLGGAGGVLPPPPPPTLTREQRQQLTSRYLQELFRSRIASRFHYPAEAEELGLEGLVTLRVSIDSDGQLLGIRVQGACPHAMLCDAALRTVRESVPFPPPPAELGGGFAVDVPFQYRLE
jgi:protein TonB